MAFVLKYPQGATESKTFLSPEDLRAQGKSRRRTGKCGPGGLLALFGET